MTLYIPEHHYLELLTLQPGKKSRISDSTVYEGSQVEEGRDQWEKQEVANNFLGIIEITSERKTDCLNCIYYQLFRLGIILVFPSISMEVYSVDLRLCCS